MAVLAAGPAHAAFPGPNGTIAFTGVRWGGPPEVMRMGPNGGSALTLAPGSHPAWSPDGQRLAFADGTDVYVANPDGSDPVLILDWNLDVEGITWAPSGDRLAAALGVCVRPQNCRVDIHVIELGPAGAQSVVDITPDLFSERNPAWSPGGDRIAFDTVRDGSEDVYTMDVDGGSVARLTTHPAGDLDPSWAPSGDAIAFTSTRDGREAIYTMNADGTTQTPRTTIDGGPARQPAWSPDGTLIAFSGIREVGSEWRLHTISADDTSERQLTNEPNRSDSEPDWQPTAIPTPVGYPRPRSASPIKVSLVPSSARCAAPNSTHGPPLGFGSCSPPSQESPNVTVGTPDANGAAAKSIGYLRFKACCFDTFDADVLIEFTLDDVRCVAAGASCAAVNDAAGADYTGELQVASAIRLTDKASPPEPWIAFEPMTTQDFTFSIPAGCSATSSTATGAVCAAHTTANAVVPGSVRDGRRAIWQMDQLHVLDGGADGDAGTPGDNRLFAKQGVFIP